MPPAAATEPNFALRAARPDDAEAIVRLIHGLADYEKLSHMVRITPRLLREQLFEKARPAAEAVVAARADAVIGFALFFTNFSTFLGKPGLYLEDLFVEPAERGHGVGRALLEHLGALAVARDYGRFEWSVLDWNASAIGFYERMGATVMPEWRICRITGEALQAYARPGAHGES